MKTRRALALYGLVVGTLVLMLSWWVVFFLRQGEFLVERADRLGAALSPAQAAAVEGAARQSSRMFLYEGTFLFAAFACGVVLILWALRREILLARQQHDFLSAVTHELRTPLSSARLAIQSLALGRVPDEKRARYLANAGSDLARLSELVERVLESSRISSGRARLRLERLDLAEFVRRRASTVASESAPELALELETSEPALVAADASALETILRNLFANAAKYAAGDAPVRVAVQRTEREARLLVRDYGPGVNGDPARLFEPFARGDGPLVKSRPGVGLGLYLVAELVRALDGKIEARNSADGRTGFEIEVRLPLVTES